MNDLEIVTKEVFEKTNEEIRRKMMEYRSLPKGESKRIVHEEINYLLLLISDYCYRNYNYFHLPDDEFYNGYYKMADRAIRNYNPEEANFWSYFSSNLYMIKAENDKKVRHEVSLVTEREYNDGGKKGVINERYISSDRTTEDEAIEELERENNEIEREYRRKAAFEKFFSIVSAMIKVKESIPSKKAPTPRYYSAFFTGDIVEILRKDRKGSSKITEKQIAEEDNEEDNEEDLFFTPKETDISEEEVDIDANLDIHSDEAASILKMDEIRTLSALDMDLLEYTYVVRPIDIDGISYNELKKYKDILVFDCRNPDKEIKVPFEAKNVYLNYFKDVHSITRSEQTLSVQRNKYDEYLREIVLK